MVEAEGGERPRRALAVAPADLDRDIGGQHGHHHRIVAVEQHQRLLHRTPPPWRRHRPAMDPCQSRWSSVMLSTVAAVRHAGPGPPARRRAGSWRVRAPRPEAGVAAAAAYPGVGGTIRAGASPSSAGRGRTAPRLRRVSRSPWVRLHRQQRIAAVLRAQRAASFSTAGVAASLAACSAASAATFACVFGVRPRTSSSSAAPSTSSRAGPMLPATRHAQAGALQQQTGERGHAWSCRWCR